MMNGCEVRVEFSGDTSEAMGLLATELGKIGYEVKKQGASELKMSFAGKLITSDPDKMKHSVTVGAEGDGLSFKFGTGLIASHWSDADKEWAQARANQVVAAIRS